MSTDNEVDFSILDAQLDDLADLKGFEPIPAGSYTLNIKWDNKEINGQPAVILKLKVADVLELADKTLDPDTISKEADIAFILKTKDGKRNEIGEGQLKQVLSVLAPVFEGSNLREIMAASDGAMIGATLKVRADKNDPDKKYNQIKSVELPE